MEDSGPSDTPLDVALSDLIVVEMAAGYVNLTHCVEAQRSAVALQLVVAGKVSAYNARPLHLAHPQRPVPPQVVVVRYSRVVHFHVVYADQRNELALSEVLRKVAIHHPNSFAPVLFVELLCSVRSHRECRPVSPPRWNNPVTFKCAARHQQLFVLH